MFRRVAALAVVLGLALVLGVVGLLRMSTVTVRTGSGPIALVQSGAITDTIAGASSAIPATLPVASTPGTLLVAIFAATTASGSPFANGPMPEGWIQLAPTLESQDDIFQVWGYWTNPGGILTASVQVTGPAGTHWYSHMSEWANARGIATATVADPLVEFLEVATATSGTSLPLTTIGDPINNPSLPGIVQHTGDLVIAGWIQAIAAPGAVTFTTPTGFTRLADNGALSRSQHLDLEYSIGAPQGSTFGTVLTSNTTTTTAAGQMLLIRAASPIVDQSAFIRDGSMTISGNTFDFQLMFGGKLTLEDGSGFYQLEDGSGVLLLDTYVPQLGDLVTVTISP